MSRGSVTHHLGWRISNQQEKRNTYTPEGNELGVRGGHSIALAMYASRSFFLDQALEKEIQGFAEELAAECEEDFGFAGGED